MNTGVRRYNAACTFLISERRSLKRWRMRKKKGLSPGRGLLGRGHKDRLLARFYDGEKSPRCVLLRAEAMFVDTGLAEVHGHEEEPDPGAGIILIMKFDLLSAVRRAFLLFAPKKQGYTERAARGLVQTRFS